jgi:hypothetical protein
MSTIITRVYPSTTQATKAVTALTKRGFAESDIKLEVNGESATVIVNAPAGWSVRAVEGLDSPSITAEPKPASTETGDALVSEVLGIPLLLHGTPPVILLDDRTTSEWFKIPTILRWRS